ncbi:hypothetical protein B566_EDAN012149 [Ephemera danica]|nr:hypothetical protein B566_EDAN012149 [Ephemera danica]
MSEYNFEHLFQNVCKRFNETSQVETSSKHFASLVTDDQRFSFAKSLLNDHDFEKIKTDVDKSETKSSTLREEGNRLFGKKRDREALLLYTQSVSYAPFKSQALTLAFANRSAVSKSLGYYNECILDIKRALHHNYPENLKYKLLTRQGECYSCMNCHEKALDSFLLAKKLLQLSGLPSDKFKEIEKNLDNHINSCEVLNDDSETTISETSLPLLSYGNNEEVLCASSAIEIKYSDGMGRHVLATRDIDPGDVLAVEQPYASVLLPEFIHTHCSNCLKRNSALLPCPQCTLAMYCSEECRETAARSHHQIECSTMSTLLAMDMGKMALLAARVITVSGTDFLSNFLEEQLKNTDTGPEAKRTLGFIDGKYNSLEFSPIYHLIANTSLRIVPDLFKRSLMAVSILKCLELDTMPDSIKYGGLILRLLQSLPCNAHEVSELCKGSQDRIAHSIEIGAAAYAALSLLNHSCDPNVVRHSHGTTAVLRAIKSIPKGSQILDNYGYHYAVHDKATRQSHLKFQYLFKCACEACIQSWPLHTKLPMNPIAVGINAPVIIKSSESLGNSLTDAMNGILTDEMLPLFFSHITTLDRHGGRLCQEYNCCQEAIKQYFAKLGNYYSIDN